MQLEQLDNVDSNVLTEEDQKSVSYESKKVHFEGNAINFFDKTNKKKRKEILTRQSISNNARNNFFFFNFYLPEQSSDDRTSQCIHPDMAKGNKVK